MAINSKMFVLRGTWRLQPLNASGWCYSKSGWYGYQNRWHKCRPGAIEQKYGVAEFRAAEKVLGFINGFGDDVPSMEAVTASIIAARKAAKELQAQ